MATEKEFSAELENLLVEDQEDLRAYRKERLSKEQLVTAASKRTCRAREIFLLTFPTIKNMGKKAYEACLVLVLHSNDIELMQKYLVEHEKQSSDAVEVAHRAFLTDKILIAKGKPQRYGTQFKNVRDGKVEFLPIESLEFVDERRSKLGMPSLTTYEQTILSNQD